MYVSNSPLTVEELMLLNNLIYLEAQPKTRALDGFGQVIDEDASGLTIEEFLDGVYIDPNTDNNNRAFISGQEWEGIARAIEANPRLMDMEIVEGHVDTETGGGGESVLMINHDTKEAVFVFRGTADNEWFDDFYGGGNTQGQLDTVSTPQQEHALEWFNEMYDAHDLEGYDVIVSGHSKGGNKAKYITILEGDAKVDRCVSFDGQGFSDEFMRKYALKIDQNKGLIENHNVEYDFVNLLLNDIGDRYFYQHMDYTGNLAEFHSPNTFFTVDANGNLNYTCLGDTPPQIMAEIDYFVNSLLRSMPGNMKEAALSFIGHAFEEGWKAAWNKTTWEPVINMVLDPANQPILEHMLEYGAVGTLFQLLNGFLNEFGKELPDWVVNMLNSYIQNVQNTLPNGADLMIQPKNHIHLSKNKDEINSIVEGLALGGAAGVAAIATINAKNSEEEHIVHDHAYYGPLVEETESSEQLVSGMEELAEAGIIDEEEEHKDDYLVMPHEVEFFEDGEGIIGDNETHVHTGGVFYINGDSDVIHIDDSEYDEKNVIIGAALQGLNPIIQADTSDTVNAFDGVGFGQSNNFDGVDFATYMQMSGLMSELSSVLVTGSTLLGKNKREFMFVPKNSKLASDNIYSASDNLRSAKQKLEKITMSGSMNQHIQKALEPIKAELYQELTECGNLGKCLEDIKALYVKNENELLGNRASNIKALKEKMNPTPSSSTRKTSVRI